MKAPTKSKSIKLSGEALELGKRAASLMREYNMARELIKERHMKEYNILCDMHVRVLDDIFKKLKAATGADDKKQYNLDIDYLEEHGDIYMVELHRDPDNVDMMNALVEKLLLNPKEH